MLDTLTWTPAALFLTVVVILTTPFLGFIALLALVLSVLAGLVGAVIAAAYELGRFVHRRWHERGVVSLPLPQHASLVTRDAAGRTR